MKKLIFIVAMLAMLVVAITPAIASLQFSQDSEQDAESGELKQSSEVLQSGDNSTQCVGEQLVGNTGNAQTSSQILQYGSEGSFKVEDSSSSIDVSPTLGTECSQSINQRADARG